MLRINLLPPYIYEGNKRRNVTILWLAILALVVGGMVFAKLQIDSATEKRREETEALRPNAELADRTKQEAANIEQANAALKAKADFVKGSIEHTASTYPTLFDNIRNWTTRNILYREVVPAGQQVNISAHAPSLSAVGHYMLAMERNPKITGMSIGMNSIPGFGTSGLIRTAGQGGAQGQGGGPRLPGGHDFSVNLNLAQPIPGAPSYPAGGGGQAAPGGGMGMPGMPNAPPPGMGGPPPGAMMGGPPPGAMGGPPPGAMGGGGASMGGPGAMRDEE